MRHLAGHVVLTPPLDTTDYCLWHPEPGSTGSGTPHTRDRAAIPDQQQWDLSHIYASWEDWEQGLARLEQLIAQLEQLKGTLGQGPHQLVAAKLHNDELGKLAYKVYQLPSLMASQDTRDNQVQARLERVNIALARSRQASAWFAPELLSLPWEQVEEWIEQTPELAPYRFPITETFRQHEHVLDEPGERLLAFAAPFARTPATTYTMLADADVSFPRLTLSTGEQVTASHASYMHTLHTSRSQADREAMFKAHISVYDTLPNTYAAIYQATLQRDWFLAQARSYDSAIAEALDEDNVPLEVVENLITTAKSHVAPLHRYHRLRKRFLGLDRYRYFDAYLPLVEVDWQLPYEEIRPFITSSVAIFGPTYQATVEQAFTERWIDVYENEGKRSGAFSAGVYGVHPYMLLNYANTLSDAFTVAHEMGHTMHTVLAQQQQPFATASYSIFVAEVASMTNEDLLMDELLRRESDSLRRIVLLQTAIDDIAASFYRQTMFADFELQAHRVVEAGEPVTATVLQELYLKVLNEFFGDCLDDQQWYANTWAQIPHFYASPYYVYQYATSKAAAGLVHQMITDKDQTAAEEAVHRYLELLGAGGNDHPISQLKRAGVDLSTSQPIMALVATMEQLVNQLERELENL